MLGEGWVGDDRLWTLSVANLTSRLYMYSDQPPTADDAVGLGLSRYWISFEIGPEQFDSSGTQTVRWEVTEWDVLHDD